jgi:hypothetical protein
MTDEREQQLAGPGAGLSATSDRADDLSAGADKPGTDYGSPGAVGADDQESAVAEPEDRGVVGRP